MQKVEGMRSFKYNHDSNMNLEELNFFMNYNDVIKPIGACDSIKTMEDFWNVYVHMHRASDLPKELNVGLFKVGHRPLWEDFDQGGGQ